MSGIVCKILFSKFNYCFCVINAGGNILIEFFGRNIVFV